MTGRNPTAPGARGTLGAMKRSSPELPAYVTALAATASLGVLGACVFVLHQPFAGDGWRGALAASRWVPASALATFAASAALAAYTRGAVRPHRALRPGAWLAAFLLSALLAASAFTSSRAPAPERYLASTTLYARLPAKSPRLGARVDAMHDCRDVIPFGPVSLERDCGRSCGPASTRCALGLVASPRRGGASQGALDATPRSPAVLASSRELRVRLDEARDLMLVDDGDALVALDPRGLQPVDVSPRTLVPALAPPRAWAALGAAGLALALALLAVSHRHRRGPEPRPATLRPDGALVLDGRVLTGVVVPPEVAPGPAVVFLAGELPPQHYRDDAALPTARVEAGTPDEHRARVAARSAIWAALALTTAALAGAPLAAWAGVSVAAIATPRPKPPATAPAPVTIEGVEVEVLAFGRGEPLTGAHDVDLHYTGTLLDGTQFDSSRERDRPFTFRYGAGQVIPGFERGMRGMRVGERRRITIPPALGYGERGAGGNVPPNATLVFDVELLAVR